MNFSRQTSLFPFVIFPVNTNNERFPGRQGSFLVAFFWGVLSLVSLVRGMAPVDNLFSEVRKLRNFFRGRKLEGFFLRESPLFI